MMASHTTRRRPVVPFLVTGILLAALVASSLPAQDRPAPPREGSPAIRVAKWGLLAAAVGIGAYALRASDDAADAYDALRALCLEAPTRCDHRGGAYTDPAAEELYDGALRADRRAQMAIFGGQAALLGGVALFIYDLRGDRGPPTIPYPGRGSAGRRIVILRLEF